MQDCPREQGEVVEDENRKSICCSVLNINRRYGPPTRTDYRVIVENLSSRVSWQVGVSSFMPKKHRMSIVC